MNIVEESKKSVNFTPETLEKNDPKILIKEEETKFETIKL